jgi:hypothetical protein
VVDVNYPNTPATVIVVNQLGVVGRFFDIQSLQLCGLGIVDRSSSVTECNGSKLAACRQKLTDSNGSGAAR